MLSGMTNELDLIRRCGLGEAAALDALYVQHGERVWRLCVRMTGNQTEAEDLSQEVWLAVFQKIGGFRCESAFSTWLYRVTVNAYLQRRRQAPPEDVISPDEMATDQRSSSEEHLAANERAARLRAAVAALPETLRSALLLRVNEELSYAAIAEVLGCTSAAAKMRIARARAMLAGAVAEEDR
jgi:RNA polymerase sigma-70 factor (ECF subfamily)